MGLGQALGQVGLQALILDTALLLLSLLWLLAASRCEVQASAKHADECIERELVEGVDLVEGVEEEEQHGAARGHVAVLVTVEVDGHLGFLGLVHLLVDLGGHALRLLQGLDQGHILGDITLCVGQLEQQLILELLQLDGKLGVLDDELRLGLLKLRPLLVHNKRQQLVLQTLLRDSEVDERGLCLDLGGVVGVGQLGVQEQAEVLVVLHLLVTHLDIEVAALLEGGTGDDGRQHRIDTLSHVLNQHTAA
mmetsp:Transcript_10037/g.27401  ORF Transcript_10037/g.27401 Transcript_10037/m.27401 type:complete len:250 (+) Transcript_10037:3448-4197(+)